MTAIVLALCGIMVWIAMCAVHLRSIARSLRDLSEKIGGTHNAN